MHRAEAIIRVNSDVGFLIRTEACCEPPCFFVPLQA